MVSFFLLAVFLASATPLHELLRLPILVQHFQEHRAQNERETILGYFFKHYFVESGRDADAARDAQLPFKNDQHPAAPFSPVVVEDDVLQAAPFIAPPFPEGNEPLYASPFHPHPALAVPWQPPDMGSKGKFAIGKLANGKLA